MLRKAFLCALTVVLLAGVAGVVFAGEVERPPASTDQRGGDAALQAAWAARLDLAPASSRAPQASGFETVIQESVSGECYTNCTCDWAICVGDLDCCDEDLAACSSLQHVFCDPHL